MTMAFPPATTVVGSDAVRLPSAGESRTRNAGAPRLAVVLRDSAQDGELSGRLDSEWRRLVLPRKRDGQQVVVRQHVQAGDDDRPAALHQLGHPDIRVGVLRDVLLRRLNERAG